MAKAEFEAFHDLEDPFQDSLPEERIEQALPVESASTTSGTGRTTGRAESGLRRSLQSSRLALVKNMTVYDAMLVASALSIMLAILLMFIELTSFDGIFFQWRTSEAAFDSITPP